MRSRGALLASVSTGLLLMLGVSLFYSASVYKSAGTCPPPGAGATSPILPSPAIRVPAESVDRAQSEWSQPVFFHVMEDGRRVDGALIAHVNSTFFDLKDKALWKPDANNACGGVCQLHVHVHACQWCNASACLTGVLKLSITRIPSGKDEKLSRFHKMMASERSDSATHKDSKMHFRTAFVTCALAERAVGPGTFSVRGPYRSIAARVAPHVSALPAERVSVVCSRGLYGYIPPRTIVLFVTHYITRMGFSLVLLYQYGLSRVSTQDPEVAALVEKGWLVLVDLRDALQATFGPFYHDLLIHSHSVAQSLTNVDCTLRARKLNAEWALFIDPDEFLVWGMNATDTSLSWPAFARSTGEPALLFSAMSLSADRFPQLGKREVCKCDAMADWDAFIALERKRHVDVETLPRDVDHWDCRSWAKRWYECNNFYAIRKIAVRLEPNADFNPSNVGSHHLHECGSPWRGRACSEPRKVALPVNPYTMYLRHYSCLNGPCEGGMPEFWWRDARRKRPEDLGEHSRGILHGRL